MTGELEGDRAADDAEASIRPPSGETSGRSRTARVGGFASVRRVAASALVGVREVLARPTASDVATIGCTLVLAVVVGTSLVGVGLALLAIASGLVAALATVLLASDDPRVRTLGGAVAVPASLVTVLPTVLAGALALSGGVSLFAGVVVWALVVAGLASGLVSWHRLGRGGAWRGATGAALAAIGVVAVVAVRLFPDSTARARAGEAASSVFGVAWDALVVADGTWAVVWFAALLFVAATAGTVTLEFVAFERLVPPDRRETLENAMGEVRRGCSHAARFAVVIVLVAFVTPSATDRFADVPVTPAAVASELPAPIGSAFAAVATASSLRLVLLAVLALSISVSALEWVRRTRRRNVAVVGARLCAPAIGAATVAVVIALALSTVGSGVDLAAALEGTAPPSLVGSIGAFPRSALVAALLVVALCSLSGLLSTVTALRVLRLLPERAIGGALAAGSAFALAVGLAVVGRIELAIVAGALAFVLWDVGEYADGVRYELGRESPTLRVELVHVTGTLLSGAAVAGATIALSRWIATDPVVADRTSAAIVVAVGVLAVVVVAWSLRA
ncbi:hypothetical protein [Natrarchaeobius oligotrophus]|nr:hypothetical protein [Natrarchaeobius chitinivorans]